MPASLDELEARLAELEARYRRAVRARDKAAIKRVRAERSAVEEAVMALIDDEDDPGNGGNGAGGQAAPHPAADDPAAVDRAVADVSAAGQDAAGPDTAGPGVAGPDTADQDQSDPGQSGPDRPGRKEAGRKQTGRTAAHPAATHGPSGTDSPAVPDSPSGTRRGPAPAPPAPALRAVRAAGSRPSDAVPVREQVHQALSVLGAPAAPKMISAVYEAFFTEALVPSRLASLRRDEERSFRAQGHSRPYYICAALAHDRLTAAHGLLAVSTWPLERRVVAPLSPRVDFLTHAARIAEQILRMREAGREPAEAAWRLLRRFAFNVPGAYDSEGPPDPGRVAAAARAESAVHAEADQVRRRESAAQARARLTDVQQLFGAGQLGIAGRTRDTPS
ncbi:hypothetical protein RKE29_20995 [Streptomyces sp. B1866]|uniref:hypothetical protein n=1 Tax=Streptomyces sp. B1866 TaxID=3075431 RepID=UPI00288EB26E|nr:hypothetical protein [Streptomyces sp. B1866]MDT3399092.1 hypothetical protein [Streptomyces sp. B1866]